jgi:hypothetical protein
MLWKSLCLLDDLSDIVTGMMDLRTLITWDLITLDDLVNLKEKHQQLMQETAGELNPVEWCLHKWGHLFTEDIIVALQRFIFYYHTPGIGVNYRRMYLVQKFIGHLVTPSILQRMEELYELCAFDICMENLKDKNPRLCITLICKYKQYTKILALFNSNPTPEMAHIIIEDMRHNGIDIQSLRPLEQKFRSMATTMLQYLSIDEVNYLLDTGFLDIDQLPTYMRRSFNN